MAYSPSNSASIKYLKHVRVNPNRSTLNYPNEQRWGGIWIIQDFNLQKMYMFVKTGN